MKEERNEDQAARCFTGGSAVVAACLSSCSPTALQTPGFTKESDCTLNPFTLQDMEALEDTKQENENDAEAWICCHRICK